MATLTRRNGQRTKYPLATMGISDLFSKTLGRARRDVPDVYIYDHIPAKLRNQAIDAIGRMIHGTDEDNLVVPEIQKIYTTINSRLCAEYGITSLNALPYPQPETPHEELCYFINGERRYERVLDAIQACTRIGQAIHDNPRTDIYGRKKAFPNALSDINRWFKESGVGYQFEAGQVIRIDSEYLHDEAVVPALHLLNSRDYAGPQHEFLKAHNHYRHGRFEEAITDAVKAFESTMKAICAKRNWPHKPSPSVSQLILCCSQNGLFKSYHESHFTHIGQLLGGVATPRNNDAAHGSGPKPRVVDDEFAAFALHTSAAAIAFLIKSDQRLGK